MNYIVYLILYHFISIITYNIIILHLFFRSEIKDLSLTMELESNKSESFNFEYINRSAHERYTCIKPILIFLLYIKSIYYLFTRDKIDELSSSLEIESFHEEPEEIFFHENSIVHKEDQNYNQCDEVKTRLQQPEEQSDNQSEDQTNSQTETEEYRKRFQEELENEERNFLEWGVTVPEAINHYIEVIRKNEADEEVN